MEAQLAACKTYVDGQGGTVLSHYQDIASGGDDTRPGLSAAVALCRLHKKKGAVLVVSAMDRLSRDVAFTAATMKQVRVIAAEAPLDPVMVQQLKAVLAEDMRRVIREKTRLAMQAGKARGMKFGSAREGAWAGIEEKRIAGLVKARAKLATMRAQAKGGVA